MQPQDSFVKITTLCLRGVPPELSKTGHGTLDPRDIGMPPHSPFTPSFLTGTQHASLPFFSIQTFRSGADLCPFDCCPRETVLARFCLFFFQTVVFRRRVGGRSFDSGGVPFLLWPDPVIFFMGSLILISVVVISIPSPSG